MKGSIALGLVFFAAVGCARPAASPPSGVAAEKKLLPARVRRLTNLEYERAVSNLVGAPQTLADLLPPDVRQEGYTPNAAQSAPASLTTELDRIARSVAAETVKSRLSTLSPCAAARPDRDCAKDLIQRMGRRAFRRPLDRDDEAPLLAAFDAGAGEGRGFAGGAELVLRVLLQSPSFLYLTEFGGGGKPGAIVTLSQYEIASLLSYTLRGEPPDETLLAAAEAGSLSSPDAREQHARRLIGMSDTRLHFRRFILEWLEVDGLARTAKSASLYPDYEELKSKMLNETEAFVDEVMVHGGASVKSLLGAGFASVDPQMARFYELKTFGPRASLAGTARNGVLQQASFLAAHAHEDSTSPVKRGDFVMRKLLCNQVRRPAELGIDLMIPPPSQVATTRERFSQHQTDPSCSGCHQTLDAFGFSFEGFDAIGRKRTEENGKTVDTRSSLVLNGASRSFANSFDLSRYLASEPSVDECFARQAFRYFSAQADPRVEQSFLELRKQLPDRVSGNLIEELIGFVRSDLFVEREVPPP